MRVWALGSEFEVSMSCVVRFVPFVRFFFFGGGGLLTKAEEESRGHS